MKIFNKVYTSLVFLFLYAPIFVLVMFSFNDSKSRSVWSGFTLKWYAKLFQNSDILSAFSNTLIIATISAVLATILGTVAAIGIMGTKKWTKKLIMNVTNIPMMNPEIVTGVSFMLLFVFIYNRTGLLKPGMLTLVLSHTTFCLPYVVLSVLPKIRQMDPNLYEAAQDLGCNPARAFFKGSASGDNARDYYGNDDVVYHVDRRFRYKLFYEWDNPNFTHSYLFYDKKIS